MTFDDDFVRLMSQDGKKLMDMPCRAINLEWPPPHNLSVFGFDWVLLSISQLTDDERASMTHVIRGAEYALVA